jgi:hypothetical protein
LQRPIDAPRRGSGSLLIAAAVQGVEQGKRQRRPEAIYFGSGTIMILGPKAFEFFDDFSNHRATAIKADGEEILSVEIDLNKGE